MFSKIIVHAIAVQFTQSLMSHVSVQAPADATISDQNMKALIDTHVEVHKVFYAWIASSLTDPNNWKVGEVNVLNSLATMLGLPQGQIGQIVSGLVGKLISGAVSSGLSGGSSTSPSSILNK